MKIVAANLLLNLLVESALRFFSESVTETIPNEIHLNAKNDLLKESQLLSLI